MRITAKYLKSVYDDGTYGLRDVNVDIPDGKFAVVVGASGCGKTTLLKVIAGLNKQTAGELYFDGLSAAKVPPKNRQISMVFQEYLLYPKYTVWENLSLALERENLSREEEEKRIERALKMFGVENLAGQLPRVLSGGQQQRVALAKAAVTEPRAVLFDEPLANVAEANRAEYADNIKLLKKSMPDTTFVYVTHKLSEALHLADLLIVMKDGVVLQCGSPDFVTSNPYCEDVLDALTDEALRRDGNKIFNTYTNSWQIFASDGLIDGVKRTESFVGNFDGTTLTVCGNTIVNENLRMRFASACGNVRVEVPADKFRSQKADGDIAVTRMYDDGEGMVKTLLLPDEAFDESGTTYFSADDIELRDKDGNVLTAHYRLYCGTACGRVAFGKLRLPCGSVPYDGAEKGAVKVTVKPLARATVGKHGFAVERCLDEQEWNGAKLCHCALRGFDKYVTLLLPRETNLFVGKQRVIINKDDIQVTK